MTKENVFVENYDEFNYAVENLISSKYLLIDRRISELLRAIASNDRIYNLIAECMVNFDFIEEWRTAIKINRLVLPEEANRKISFVFCMLNNIDDKNLDLTKVLEHYFSYDETKTPYEVFCRDVILEFRNTIFAKLGMVSRESATVSMPAGEMEKTTESLQNELVSTLAEMRNLISSMRRPKLAVLAKEDVLAVISTFEFAARNNQTEYFYVLLITLKSTVAKLREVKPHINKVDELSRTIVSRSRL